MQRNVNDEELIRKATDTLNKAQEVAKEAASALAEKKGVVTELMSQLKGLGYDTVEEAELAHTAMREELDLKLKQLTKMLDSLAKAIDRAETPDE